jgi:tetratricopeptide (TPR) repeat protein
LKGMIIYSPRIEIRPMIKEASLSLNILDLNFSNDVEEISKILDANPRYYFVIDFQNEFKLIEKIFKKNKENKIRSILFLAKDMTDQISAFCCEYSISEIHVGQISKDSILEKIKILKKEDELEFSVRNALSQISDFKNQGKINESIQSLKNLINQYPNHEHIRSELGDIYIMQGEWKKAKEVLLPILSSEEPYVKGLHLLAKCFMKERKYQDAIQVYKKAKILNPYNVERLIELGQLLLKEGLTKEAESNFKEAQKIEPKNIQASVGESQCKMLEGDLSSALKMLKHISSEKELVSIFNGTAIIAIKTGHFEEGLKLYDQAIGLVAKTDKENHGKLLLNKGLGYKKASQEEKALECFLQAIELNPDLAKAKSNLEFIEKRKSLNSTDDNDIFEQFSLNPTQAIDDFEE